MITDIQVGTASTCIRMFQQSCGLHSMKNVAIITTMWDNVTSHTGEQWEKALGALFKPLLDDGAVIMRHDRTPESATAIINHLLKEHTTPHIAHELAIPPEETAEAKKNKAPTKAEDDRSVIWNKTSSVADEEPANELPGVPMKGARRRNETGCVLTSNSLSLEHVTLMSGSLHSATSLVCKKNGYSAKQARRRQEESHVTLLAPCPNLTRHASWIVSSSLYSLSMLSETPSVEF